MRLEMKMWPHSVDPMPSRMSAPVRARQRSRIEPASGSPALTQTRTELKSAVAHTSGSAASVLA